MEIDSLLGSHLSLKFTVTHIVRAKPVTYSQVFFGVLSAPDGSTLSAQVCLKLFLECMFPIQHLIDEVDMEKDWDSEDQTLDITRTTPFMRLLSLNTAADMVRSEEFTYQRLGEQQGHILPHFYGAHSVCTQSSLRSIFAYQTLLNF